MLRREDDYVLRMELDLEVEGQRKKGRSREHEKCRLVREGKMHFAV